MSKYIEEECKQCDEYITPYGCTNHGCSIYKNYQEGRAEMAADNEHDKRKDNRLDPVFQDILERQGIMKTEGSEWKS